MSVQINNQNANPVPVSDAGSSVTVDAPVAGPVFVRLSDGAAAITTLPVSLASVPGHAVTNAGTFAVQESGAALTALQLIDNIVLAEDAVHASGDPGVMLLAVRSDTPANTAGTNGDYSALITDSTGRLHCNVSNAVSLGALPAGTNNIGDVDVLTVPADPFGANADAASATGSISAKLRFIASTGIPITGTVTVGSHAVTNAGTFAVQDSEKVADDAAFTVGTTKVSPVGYLADETATDSVDEGDVGAARMTLDRKQHVVAELECGSMRSAGAAVTPKYAAIAASTSGNNTLVAAVTGKKIRVLAYNLMGNGAVNAKFQSGAGGTDLTGLKYVAAAGGGICAPYNPVGWFETGSNTLLNLNLSAAVAVGGEIVYVEV
jgi:hypothetical protein